MVYERVANSISFNRTNVEQTIKTLTSHNKIYTPFRQYTVLIEHKFKYPTID